jgi:hypothetical protein
LNPLAASHIRVVVFGFFFIRRFVIFCNTCFDELVDCEVMVDGVEGDDDCFIFFWRIFDCFFRTGVRGPCLQIVDFFTGVPGPFPAFNDFLFLFPTEEDLDDFNMGVRRPAFAFVDFLFFAGAPLAFCFEFLVVPAVDVFDRTDLFFFATLPGSGIVEFVFFFFFFFATLPGSGIVEFVCLFAFMFGLTVVAMNGMCQELSADMRDFRGRTKLFRELSPPL